MVNRIRELLEIRQLSPTQFADLIGVGRPVISHILSERNKPSLEVVQKVISAFPDVSLSWLMSGIGPMLTGATPTTTATPPIDTVPIAFVADIPPTVPVQSVVLAQFSPTLIAPPQAVPAPIAPIPAPAPLPAAVFTPPVAQPSRLPQPPKFRPAQAAPSPEPPAPAPVSQAGPVAAPLLATPPIMPASTPVSEFVASPGVSLPPAPPVPSAPAPPTVAEVPPVAPIYSASVESAPVAAASIATPAPVPAGPTEVLSPAAYNPAAAFSFLGEAGKTIRRIVIFYSDGSFSDYRPEGQ